MSIEDQCDPLAHVARARNLSHQAAACRHIAKGALVYLTDKQVAARFGVSRITIWRWASDLDFPAPVKLSPGATRWRLADVEAWEATRRAA